MAEVKHRKQKLHKLRFTKMKMPLRNEGLFFCLNFLSEPQIKLIERIALICLRGVVAAQDMQQHRAFEDLCQIEEQVLI